LNVISSPQNRGLAISIISGINQIINDFGVGIFLDDDLIIGPHFLNFMNKAIALYKDDPKVCSIHGFSYLKNVDQVYFLKGGDCCGWATWKSAWSHFESDGNRLLNQLVDKRMTYEFDVNGTYPYTQMLKDQIAGRNNSWAIRWRAATFLKGMYTLYPPKALYLNDGFDGSGTNCPAGSGYNVVATDREISIPKLKAAESPRILSKYRKFLMPSRRQRILKRVLSYFEGAAH
jgi:hypothetical protein